MRLTRDDRYEVDDDLGRIQLDVVHGFLHEAYWSAGVSRAVVERSLHGSTVVGLYAPDGGQVGMARAVTDRATFAWVSDVFVLEPHRGRGLGRWVVSALLEHPDVAGLRWTMLATADAHGLYRSLGFGGLDTPERFMGRARRGESGRE